MEIKLTAPVVLNRKVWLVKTVHYLSFDMDDLAMTTEINGSHFVFPLFFERKEEEPATLISRNIREQLQEQQPGLDMPQMFAYSLTFINFDGATPVYNKEPIFLGVLDKHELFMRVKVERPYENAAFREILFCFYLSHKEVEK